MRPLLAAVLLTLVAVATAGAPIYDEASDAHADLRAALADASRANLPLLVVFGANWCGDCTVLDAAFRSGSSARLIADRFKVLHVNVGRFDHNVDIAKSLGVPLRDGIPAVAVLTGDGRLIYATRAGELADARTMGDKGIYEFFARVSSSIK